MPRIILLIFLFAFTSCISSAQNLKPAAYKQDFVVLRNALEKEYPSLYRFTDKQTMDKLLDSCYNSINDRTTMTSFYATVKLVVSAIGDGHMSCRPSDELRKNFEQQQYFPLGLVFLKDKAYVDCDYPQIPKGAEILSINNVSINNIRQKLYKYLPSDGKIESSKNEDLKSVFWFYYYLAYGEQTSFNVQYKTLSAETKNTNVSPVKGSYTPCHIPAPADKPYLQLSFPEKNIAILTIKTFDYTSLKAANEDFGSFLDSAFSNINRKKISNLIIDLRNNGGGADVYGSYLYTFLTNKPFKYYSDLRTSQKVLTVADHPNLGIQKPNDIYYDGQVFVLVNGLSFSATTEFCSVARSNDRVKFIGEETGGAYVGNTSGGNTNKVLPNTKITVSIPATRYTMAVKETKLKDRGIIPDYIVTPSITEYLQGKDVQLAFAMDLARKR